MKTSALITKIIIDGFLLSCGNTPDETIIFDNPTSHTVTFSYLNKINDTNDRDKNTMQDTTNDIIGIYLVPATTAIVVGTTKCTSVENFGGNLLGNTPLSYKQVRSITSSACNPRSLDETSINPDQYKKYFHCYDIEGFDVDAWKYESLGGFSHSCTFSLNISEPFDIP